MDGNKVGEWPGFVTELLTMEGKKPSKKTGLRRSFTEGILTGGGDGFRLAGTGEIRQNGIS